MVDRVTEPPSGRSPQRQERWVKVALAAGLLLIVAWLYFSSPNGAAPANRPTANTTSRSETTETSDRSAAKPTSKRGVTEPSNEESAAPDDSLIVHNARVTNEDGRVIHRGDVDLRPTIERIERGKRLRFSHDGSVFENRERRLPSKPSGYYREFIHPAPDDDGPGGQRVVIGREGEVYYTPDHYKTFRRVR